MRFNSNGIVLIVIAALFIVGCSSHDTTGKTKENNVQIQDGMILESTYQLIDTWKVNDDDGVKQIHDLNPPNSLDYITDVEWFNKLRLWLRETCDQGPEAFSFPFYPPLMVELMRNDQNCRATCGPFSVAYAGLLLSFDIPVRIVHAFSFSRDSTIESHTFTEVWSDQLQKWIVEDVYLNIFWMDTEGNPVSARELQYEFTSGKDPAEIRVTPRKDMNDPPWTENEMGDFFYRLVICNQSNYFYAYSVPYLEYQKGFLFHLMRPKEDEAQDPGWLAYKEKMMITDSDDLSEIYAPVNQIEIDMMEQKEAYVFNFHNNIFNFDHYEINANSIDWQPFEGEQLILRKDEIQPKEVILIRGVSERNHRTATCSISF
jgi:hypothetical protein